MFSFCCARAASRRLLWRLEPCDRHYWQSGWVCPSQKKCQSTVVMYAWDWWSKDGRRLVVLLRCVFRASMWPPDMVATKCFFTQRPFVYQFPGIAHTHRKCPLCQFGRSQRKPDVAVFKAVPSLPRRVRSAVKCFSDFTTHF